MSTPPLHTKTRSVILRRDFIAYTAGTALLLVNPLNAAARLLAPRAAVTVGNVMDKFISQVPGGTIPNTVDTLKAGNRDIVVKGVVTTMFATIEVIRKTIAMGANFIIAHEPTFYNHRDDTQWLEQDKVYQYKAGLLKEHNIAVWRNHDYIHTLRPDGVITGVIKQLGWQHFAAAADAPLYTLNPAPSLGGLINQLKQKMAIPHLRYMGGLQYNCRNVLFIPGAAGGKTQIEALMKYQPDVLVCGEISEWETAEYVRDAQAMGKKLSLVLLGHIASEEPGSAFMAEWLRKYVPGLPVTHMPPGNSLSFI